MNAPQDWWVLCAVFVVIVALLFTGKSNTHMQKNKMTSRVSYVVDGDTFYLEGQRASVRLWAINAPEMDEDGGQAAALYLAHMIDTEMLTCDFRAVDRYGRHIARCFLPDGRDVGAEMIRAGHAKELKRYSKGYYRQFG